MKVQREEPKFRPITITLESEYEAEVLITVLGKIIGGGDARKVTDTLFGELAKLGVIRLNGGEGKIDVDRCPDKN